MKTINLLLKEKGHSVWIISPDASVFDAIKLMADKEVGALPVVKAEHMIGIISERDYARKVILQGRSSKETKVREIMTHHVVYITPEQTVEECMALMTEKHIRHLPVMSDRKLVGIVSIGDLVRSIISDQKVLIRKLENHILEVSSIT